ncbi:hypothetical protein TCAL_06149 [Tigriopus californicus]|uniref:Uncharacterized protein n=2 Tax=Tigriopus californicus TaxID=6832 RepID=A0A553PLK1_TIGCA|nr:hypothetical protein TCAL_06149 [Tigriopus californicus]
MNEESSQNDKENVIREVLGEVLESIELDTEALQVNAQGLKEGQIRVPQSVIVVPSQKMVVVGFDSGEMQFYFGLPDKLESGSGFKISDKDPVAHLDHASNWCPFSNVKVDKGSVSSVVVASSGLGEALTLWWILDQEIRLPWIKYQFPSSGYILTDLAFCRRMSKVIVGTQKGRLLIYESQIQRFADMGQMEEVVMVKVAHEGRINCIHPDEQWLLSSGSDGRVAIWMWEADQFLHQIGSLFITNLPILSVYPCGPNELICTLDSYILSLHILRNPANRRQCSLRQNPRGHVKMEPSGGKVTPSSSGMAVLRGHDFDPQDRLFLVLREDSKELQVIGQGIGLSVLTKG